ncbi:MAG: hypothetical protein KKB90_12470 [Actinobacteria bacterium]|nr:hypothetical protein [Actinomycetota bacterium]MCG2817903.1 hypothetical protein [Actinomycetes bacterium]MBU4178737.1 hypothetical protein [Actinomycetota bacterium]MBU4219760.1 hypothetical protein [Actinomycetota bacterium]MBU4357832.1 hypothetical protein [Actinomycetota bacterium]
MEFITCPNCGKTYPTGYGVCPFCGEAKPPEGLERELCTGQPGEVEEQGESDSHVRHGLREA